MVFALATDDWGLLVFPTEAEAMGYCEEVDVEEGNWLFFSDNGAPLAPHFTVPKKQWWFLARPCAYSLLPATEGMLPSLQDSLAKVAYVDKSPTLRTVADVQRYLEEQSVKSLR